MNINEIEKLTQKLAEARNELSAIITRLQLKQGALMQDFLPDIKRTVAKAADRHGALYTGINQSRGLFVDPRTVTINGIKVGLRKGTGGITHDDPEAIIVQRIEDRYSKAEAEKLVKTEKSLRKKAVGELDVKELKALGLAVEDTGDVIYIKPTDTAVDKIVNALLKGATDEAQKEVAA